jgi:hypothetical protein
MPLDITVKRITVREVVEVYAFYQGNPKFIVYTYADAPACANSPGARPSFGRTTPISPVPRYNPDPATGISVRVAVAAVPVQQHLQPQQKESGWGC